MSKLIEKKNRQMYFDGANEHQCFGLRKLTIGIASVLLGATLFLGGHTQEAHADTLNTSTPMKNATSTGEKAASQELSNASQDNVPTNPKVEQAKTPATGTSQSQSASVTSEAQSTNTHSSQPSQNKSAALNTNHAHQVTQSVNATPTVNSQGKSAPAQAHGQVPEANYTPAQASQNKSATLNTNNAHQATQSANATPTVNSQVKAPAQVHGQIPKANYTPAQASQNKSATLNTDNAHQATQSVPAQVHKQIPKANDTPTPASQDKSVALNNNVTNNAPKSVPISRKNIAFEHLLNEALYVDSFPSTGGNDGNDVDISWPQVPANQTVKSNSPSFTLQPGEPYDTTQGIKTVTRNVDWYIIKANDTTIPTGHTVIDTINFYEPQAQDDQGHLLPEYSWAHWNNSLDQHFTNRARETEQILHDNNNIRLDHVYGGTSTDVAGATLITPDSPNQNIKVYFKEGKISTLIRFVDGDSNNGNNDGDQVVLSELSIEGPQGSYIDDTSQLSKIRTTLQNYLNRGYKVEDGGNPFSPQSDGDAHADPNAVESLTAQYRPVDGDPDSTAINIMLYHNHKIFGGPQDIPNPKTGQKDKNTQSVVNRIISYVYDNGLPVMDTKNQPSKAIQTVAFSRQADVDMVTGNVIYAPWDKQGTFAALPSTAINGYTPDKAIVPEQTVNATDPDSNVTVTYKKNAPVNNDASGQVNYIDDNNNGNVIQTGSFNGKVGDPINYSTQPTIKDLKNKGYELVSDNFGTTPHTFKDGNNNYEVHFKHSYETVKPGNEKTPGTPINPNDPNGPKWPNGTDKNSVDQTGKRTINYTGANSQTPQPKVDTTNFTRQVVVDKVTGQITSATDWQPTSHQFDQVKTPFINYFYADKLYAGNLSVSPSNLEATDLVTYQPMANIIPIDEGHHKIPNVPNPQYTTNPQDPTKATPNQLVPSIQNMVPDQKTVTPINPGQPTEIIYRESKIPTKRKAARLIFKLNNTKTRNITDLRQIQSLPTMMTDGTSGAPMNAKTIPDVYTVDSSGVVSGPDDGDTSKWRAIASANGVNLDAPAQAGYTWKIAKITGTDTSQDIYFVYSKAPDQSSLNVVVHDNTTNQDLPQYGYYHKDVPGTTINYDWPTQKQHLIDNGYKIVNEPTVPSTIPDKPQTITITVEHDVVPDNNTDHKHTPGTLINPQDPNGPKWPTKDNFTKDYTYTVNFNDQNGNKVADPQHQVSTWNRTVYVDKVTGEIKPDQSTPWTPDKPNYGNINVPVVNGYVANKTSKNGSPVSNILSGPKTEQKDTTDTVTYNTVGKIVPVDPSGKPIPGAEQPKYINDPKDPTKVTPNEKVPALPGKTPRQTSVTPVNPAKDTHIIYDDAVVDTSLKVIIHDQTDNRDLTGYGFNSGTVKSGTRVPYTFNQDHQKLIDHGYEIVNVPEIPTVYGKKPQTVTITVKHAVAPVDTSLKVIVHDQTDNRELTGYGFNSGTVKSGTRVLYTFKQDRQKLIDHGYEIVNVPAIPTVYGKKPQTVTITVKHAVAPVNNQDHKHTPGTPVNPNDPNGPKWPAKDNYSQDHTYTVSFSGPDGKQLAGPKRQTSHWNRTLNIDKVTGQILNSHEPWKSDITNYQDTKVPVINGYVANKTSKNGSPVSKILPGAKAVPSDITDTVKYGKIGRIIPVDSSGKPIPGASTPMYENDPDDPTKVKRTDVPYIKGYTPSVNSVDPKDPTKDTNVVYQKDQPDIVPDNPNENLPSVPNDSNNDLGNFKTPKKKAKKTPKKKAKKVPAKKAQGSTKQAPVNNNAKQPTNNNNTKQPTNNNNAKQLANNNNAGPANKAKAPVANVAQAATLPNKVVTKQAPANNAKKALPQTGEDQNDLMILAVGSLLGAMSLATLAGTRRKRKHE